MRYAAFLRAVNVAGSQVSMSALKAMLAGMGLEDPQTLLQSGNIVFGSEKRAAPELEALLEKETEKRLKVRTEYFVRVAGDLQQIIKQNPFQKEAKEDPSHLLVMFLKKTAGARDAAALQSKIMGPEVVKASGLHLYVTYPEGIGRSKLTNAVIENALGTRATARNWNTVLKMAAAVD